MKIPFSPKIEYLAKIFPVPLYCVGGYVRNFIISGKPSADVDLSAPLKSQAAIKYFVAAGFNVVAEYKKTETVVFSEKGQTYEFTSFRVDEYSGGGHSPEKTAFTEDILSDACRRDFKCNAVYYDIKNGTLTDPLGGLSDIENKILDTTKSPETVFSHDGLRLMRLARFSGELGFKPTEKVIKGAEKHAGNINDVATERVYDELKKILVADVKYPFSDSRGHYNALKVLDRTRVLDGILPELAAGRGLAQRKDFHDYDVLEHSLRAVLYSDRKIRLYALIHDVGKPACFKKTGAFTGHDKRGEEIVRSIAARLKFENRVLNEAAFLTNAHSVDFNLDMRESKVRLFIAENLKYFPDLMLLKQADYSACKDDLSIAPTVLKWRGIYKKMTEEKLPLTVKELNITAEELMDLGYKNEKLGAELKNLLKKAIAYEIKNERKTLIKAAERDLRA